MSERKKAEDRAQALVDAVLDGPVDDAESRAAVQELGIDVASLATRLRAQVAAQDKHDRAARLAQIERDRQAALSKLRAGELVEGASRQKMLTIMTNLIQQAGPSASIHYMKFEEATDEELAEMIRSLEYLLTDGGT